MTALVAMDDYLVGDVNRLAAAIADATLEDASAAHDRLKMAREWAALQENAEELAERLVWLEATILRRIGQLDVSVLHGSKRPAARHFTTLDDAELQKLLNDYPARTATAAFRLWDNARRGVVQRRRGMSRARGRDLNLHFAVGAERGVDESDGEWKRGTTLDEAVRVRRMSVREAAAVLLSEYASAEPSTTVSRVVEQFIIDEQPISDDADPLEVSAFREGLTSAVRAAFSSAVTYPTERSQTIPAFITAFDPDTGEWLRIQSEFATRGDARQMIASRRAMAQRLLDTADHLETVLELRFRLSEGEDSDWLRHDVTAENSRRLWEVRTDHPEFTELLERAEGKRTNAEVTP